MTPHIDNPHVIGVDLRNEIRGVTDRLLWNSWATAAEEAADRMHLLQPEWLIVVEGVSSGNVISGAHRRPVRLSAPNKLVYSAHVYGWSGWGALQPYWKRSYKSFAKDMDKHWAFLLDQNIAPVWVGEFGAPDVPNKGDVNYWQHLMRYLEEKDVDFGYWAINPRKPHNNEWESYGLLEDDWETPRYDYRLYDMRRLAREK
jgi:endoglucanase